MLQLFKTDLVLYDTFLFKATVLYRETGERGFLVITSHKHLMGRVLDASFLYADGLAHHLNVTPDIHVYKNPNFIQNFILYRDKVRFAQF